MMDVEGLREEVRVLFERTAAQPRGHAHVVARKMLPVVSVLACTATLLDAMRTERRVGARVFWQGAGLEGTMLRMQHLQAREAVECALRDCEDAMRLVEKAG